MPQAAATARVGLRVRLVDVDGLPSRRRSRYGVGRGEVGSDVASASPAGVRELRGGLELLGRVTGELQAGGVTVLVVDPRALRDRVTPCESASVFLSPLRDGVPNGIRSRA